VLTGTRFLRFDEAWFGNVNNELPNDADNRADGNRERARSIDRIVSDSPLWLHVSKGYSLFAHEVHRYIF
jgi:hypothetical protein